MQKVREGIALTERTVLYALLLLPFFEPLSFNIFSARGYHAALFSVLGDVFLAGRLAVSAAAYMIFIRKMMITRFRIDRVAFLLALQMASVALSCLMNGSISAKVVAQVFTYVGFVLICTIMLEEGAADFLGGGVLCFGLLSAVGAISILTHPAGFLTGEELTGKYYLLGAKNTAFPYYFAFLLFWFMRRGLLARRLPHAAPVLAVFIVTARICDSTGTTICLALILIFYLLAQYFPRIMRKIRPQLLFAGVVVIILICYMGMLFPPMVAFLTRVGRGTTFTGRDYLWEQAIAYFKSSPIFGAGENLVFTLRGGTQTNHAHSQYLNRLAKYGLVHYVFFIPALLIVEHRLEAAKDRLLSALAGAMLMIYLLHMAFDDYSFNFFLVLMLLASFVAAGGRLREDQTLSFEFS